MRQARCPGVLLQQRRELLGAHGTATWSGELPPNVELVVDNGDKLEDFLDFISKARLVVVPRLKNDIAPTGISTYLVAMGLNKCVIISEGPGASDVLTDEAVIVPAEDAGPLAEQIKLLWGNATLRTSVASRGKKYAAMASGKDRLHRDILRASVQSLNGASLTRISNHPDETTIRYSLPIAAPMGVRQTREDG
jgi:hypothetical protein